MRILLTGGGTGGHVYPAIAIADEIKYRYPDTEILFAGRTDCIEGEVVPKSGYKIKNVTVYGFERYYGFTKKVETFFKMFKGFSDAVKIIDDFKPDVVVGTGGFVSGPVVLAATMKHIKTIIHEQNAVIGFTVKVLSARVDTVCASFESSIPLLPKAKNVVLTGNPVRREISMYTKEIARKTLKIPQNAKMLLCFGGSQGAKKINDSMIDVIEKYINNKTVYIYHVTGTANYTEFTQQLRERNIDVKNSSNITVLEYAHEMPLLLCACDLVVSRSGALTIAEITNLGLPAIYVPYPFAVHNHQYENAKVIVDGGGALLISDDKITGETLYSKINALLFDEVNLKEMGKNSLKLAYPEAAKKICEEIVKLVK